MVVHKLSKSGWDTCKSVHWHACISEKCHFSVWPYSSHSSFLQSSFFIGSKSRNWATEQIWISLLFSGRDPLSPSLTVAPSSVHPPHPTQRPSQAQAIRNAGKQMKRECWLWDGKKLFGTGFLFFLSGVFFFFFLRSQFISLSCNVFWTTSSGEFCFLFLFLFLLCFYFENWT